MARVFGGNICTQMQFYGNWNRVEGYSMSMQLPAINFTRLMQAEDANSEKRHKGLLESWNSKWYIKPRFLSRVSRPHTNHTKAATGYSSLRDYSEQLKMCICICISRKPLLGRSSREGDFGYKIDSI